MSPAVFYSNNFVFLLTNTDVCCIMMSETLGNIRCRKGNIMKTIKVGIVGARGMSTVMGLRAIPGVEITALCNLDENILEQSA